MGEKQANSRFCFVCGLQNDLGLKLKFYEVGARKTRAETIIEDSFQGYPGIVHGGVIAAMLDEAAGRTVMNNANPDRMVVTGKMDIRYRKPVSTGNLLVITGELVEDKGRISIAASKIHDDCGNLLAEAQVTLVEIPRNLRKNITWQPEDWRVYPDEEGSK
jgi:uncharacterized protein (TIGR00369 family)